MGIKLQLIILQSDRERDGGAGSVCYSNALCQIAKQHLVVLPACRCLNQVRSNRREYTNGKRLNDIVGAVSTPEPCFGVAHTCSQVQAETMGGLSNPSFKPKAEWHESLSVHTPAMTRRVRDSPGRDMSMGCSRRSKGVLGEVWDRPVSRDAAEHVPDIQSHRLT